MGRDSCVPRLGAIGWELFLPWGLRADSLRVQLERLNQ
jgi:hypothetical protein